MSDPLEQLLNEQALRPQPPIERWSPALVQHSRMRIARDGQWYHDGRPILRPALVQLFASILCRDATGYWLVTPAERQQVDVEDSPFIGVGLHVAGAGRDRRIVVTSNVGRHVPIDARHPLTLQDPDQPDPAAEPRPRVAMERGLHLKLSRPSFYELAALAAGDGPDDGATLGIWSYGHWFALTAA